ncbi:MAG: hypothetical protein RBR49_06500 [Desulfovibrio desulfuricans]|nr:hypothetical protein [Desulfovibrio desulfuricans]
MKIHVRLDDNTLFGNIVSEDEDDNVFESYAYRRREVDEMVSKEKIYIVKGLKGYGKSALMRIAKKELKVKGETVISKNGLDLAPDIDSSNPDQWVNGWKENIYIALAEEIGSVANISFSENTQLLIDIARESGRRNLNFLELMKKNLANLKLGVKYKDPTGQELSVEASASKQSSGLPKTAVALGNIINSHLENAKDIFIFIDDIDHNFINTPQFKAKISGLLTACRYISNHTPQIKFRLTLRPNSWAILQKEDPAMTHIRSYIHEIAWTYGEIKNLFAHRILGYLKRNGASLKEFHHKKLDALNLVFEQVRWDGQNEIGVIPIASYAKRRPRWAIEIFKYAALRAKQRNSTTINLADITYAAENYGDTVLSDLSSEFKCECNDIEKYMRTFYCSYSTYNLNDLLTFIKNNIVEHVSSPKPSSREIAHWLFYSGFLFACKEHENGRYTPYYYDDKPYLLTQTSHEDEQYRWDIELIYRAPLQLKASPAKMARHKNSDL